MGRQRQTRQEVPRAALGLVALAAAGALGFFGALPQPLALAYGIASLVAYAMYFIDKSAAGRGARRIPEATLHMASVFGGWPGALIAQQQFRHKTIKQPFQSIFWMTVVANLGLFAWLVHSGLDAGLAG